MEIGSPEDGGGADQRYVVVSCDSHVGPSQRHALRPYCDSRYLRRFDEDVESTNPSGKLGVDPGSVGFDNFCRNSRRGPGLERWDRHTMYEGSQDPYVRLQDMDGDGVVASVIFHDTINGERIPFSTSDDLGLRAVGMRIYNRWLADFVSVAPERHLGLAYVPLWDIDSVVDELEWAKDAGFVGINFPGHSVGMRPYNEPFYEPLWSACESLELTLSSHIGGVGGTEFTGDEALALMAFENGYPPITVAILIYSGVFERHPRLTYSIAEAALAWVPHTVAKMDNAYEVFSGLRRLLPRPPSEYFAVNCYVGPSFMSRAEADLRHVVGVDRIMFGVDYPHPEGLWPGAQLSMRATLSGLPADEVGSILGDNAIRCYRLDGAKLRAIADKIGPQMSEIARPLTGEEVPDRDPEVVGFGFRSGVF